MIEVWFIVVGLVTLPIFAAGQRFCSVYGYERASLSEALRSAGLAFCFGMLLALSGFALMERL